MEFFIEKFDVTIRPGIKIYTIEPFRVLGSDIVEYEVLADGEADIKLHVAGEPDWDCAHIPHDFAWEKYLGEIYFLTREDAEVFMNQKAEEYRAQIATKETLLKHLFLQTVNLEWPTPDMNVLADRIKEEFGVEVLAEEAF